MGRTLEVECQGSTSRFTPRKLTRSALYGRKRRVPVDGEGRPCQWAALTRDGRFLLPPGSTATLYLDEDGDVVERDELRSDEAEPDAAPKPDPETAEPVELLALTIRQVYVLEPVAVSDPLEALLAATGICRLAEGDETDKARFLVKNDAGYFLLVGDDIGFELKGLDEADLSVPESAEAWEDLDFAMLE